MKCSRREIYILFSLEEGAAEFLSDVPIEQLILRQEAYLLQPVHQLLTFCYTHLLDTTVIDLARSACYTCTADRGGGEESVTILTKIRWRDVATFSTQNEVCNSLREQCVRRLLRCKRLNIGLNG